MALWGGIGALAVATGPSLGALLITAFGWRCGVLRQPARRRRGVVGRAAGAGATPAPTRSQVGTRTTRRRAAEPGRWPPWCSAISEGPTGAGRAAAVLACFGAARSLLALFVRRSAHHPEPVLDLTLFRARSFSVANAATLLYAMGFFAMLLGNILFLTSVWHYSILRAGLAVTPGPARGGGGVGARRQAGRHASASARCCWSGFAVFAGGLVWYATRVGSAPDYLAVWLPATLVVGLGIGLTFPVLSAAAVSSLHHERFAVGSAVNQTARQVGGALGVALLVVHPRDDAHPGGGARQLPAPVVVRGDHGGDVRSGVRAPRRQAIDAGAGCRTVGDDDRRSGGGGAGVEPTVWVTDEASRPDRQGGSGCGRGSPGDVEDRGAGGGAGGGGGGDGAGRCPTRHLDHHLVGIDGEDRGGDTVEGHRGGLERFAPLIVTWSDGAPDDGVNPVIAGVSPVVILPIAPPPKLVNHIAPSEPLAMMKGL